MAIQNCQTRCLARFVGVTLSFNTIDAGLPKLETRDVLPLKSSVIHGVALFIALITHITEHRLKQSKRGTGERHEKGVCDKPERMGKEKMRRVSAVPLDRTFYDYTLLVI